MAREVRPHITDSIESSLAPKHLTKQEFGRRLYGMMLARQWRQSDLARASDLPRDSISSYVRGRTLPTPLSLEKLASALGCTPVDLLPNAVESAIQSDNPDFEMKVSPAAPTMAWVRVNRLVRLSTAVKIAELVEADRDSIPDRT